MNASSALPSTSPVPAALVLPTMGADALWAYAQQPQVSWAPLLAESAQLLRQQWRGYAAWAGQDWSEALSPAECRVQCWGLVTSTPQEGDPLLKAAAVAQAWAGAFWQQLPEGLFLVLRVHSPLFGVLTGTPDFLVRQQMEVQCLRQFSKELPSLVNRIPGIEHAQAVDVRWDGVWDESTSKLQRSLSYHLVQAWLAARAASANALDENDLNALEAGAA